MSFLTHEGDTVPWWWPGVVRTDQRRNPVMTVEQLERKLNVIKEDPFPVMTGVAFAITPYLVGGAIVTFAPPPWKPVGASMLVPGPTDPILFWAGYQFGEEIESYF